MTSFGPSGEGAAFVPRLHCSDVPVWRLRPAYTAAVEQVRGSLGRELSFTVHPPEHKRRREDLEVPEPASPPQMTSLESSAPRGVKRSFDLASFDSYRFFGRPEASSAFTALAAGPSRPFPASPVVPVDRVLIGMASTASTAFSR